MPKIVQRKFNPTGHRPIAAPRPALSQLEGRVTLRVREVKETTGLATSTIYEMMDDKTLRSVRVRGVRLIYVDSLREILGLAPAT